MIVKSVRCKLRTSDETAIALAETMRVFNEACNIISGLAWEAKRFRAFDLHHVVYRIVRNAYPALNSQLVTQAINKVADSYLIDRETLHKFGPRSGIAFHKRTMRFHGVASVTLSTIHGRKKYSLAHGGKQRAQLENGTTGEAHLLFVDGAFYLSIATKFPDPPSADHSGAVLGVDLGIVELATDSQGASYSGSHVQTVRRRNKAHTREVQRKRTRSAFKRLKKIGRRVSRFSKDVNHRISKALVRSAHEAKKAIALENLKGISRRETSFGKHMRWMLGSWAFFDLGFKIKYKAKELGIVVVEVDPRNTSRTCSTCGHCEKANRVSQSKFHCKQCGLVFNADFNAAKNIEARGLLSTALMFRAIA